LKTNTLGNSDMKITPIGLGTWGWGEQDDKASIKTIHAGEIELSSDELKRIADASA
jgi:aryl-alcohol dehydrogenase-like predicted oxidoreductase